MRYSLAGTKAAELNAWRHTSIPSYPFTACTGTNFMCKGLLSLVSRTTLGMTYQTTYRVDRSSTAVNLWSKGLLLNRGLQEVEV
jgi:hypothetical protein